MIKMGIPHLTHRKGYKMAIQVGTIFKWWNSDFGDEASEACESGQCVGIVTELPEPDIYTEPAVMVKFWEMCELHTKIDPEGTGPYDLAYIWQIGLFY